LSQLLLSLQRFGQLVRHPFLFFLHAANLILTNVVLKSENKHHINYLHEKCAKYTIGSSDQVCQIVQLDLTQSGLRQPKQITMNWLRTPNSHCKKSVVNGPNR
jgi:hypothetical protein